jgi:hypothetical protein
MVLGLRVVPLHCLLFTVLAAPDPRAEAAPVGGALATETGTDTKDEKRSKAAAPGEAARTPALPAARIARASRRQGSVAIDGTLDEAAWAAAPAHGDFWQRAPHEGSPPTFRTEFRVLYDDSALYIGVRAYDPEPARIRGLLTRRDVASSSDWILVAIDSYHDRRTGFEFGVNAAGVQRDVFHFNDVEEDVGWDAVWESGARVDGQGWTAEMRVPYSQLRFPNATNHEWGLQVVRKVQRTQEFAVWSPWPRETNQLVSLFGTVTGLRGIGAARRIELLPYAVVGANLYSPEDNDPLLDGHDAVTGLGLDAKIGLGSNFTVSATINPDFGQVEADPSQVNLSAQETFFQEKRPFFVEGTDIFRFSLGQGDGSGSVETLFYTRRIGATPHDTGFDYGDYADQPGATTIYGAAKLSGKTPGGWSLGLLDAVTGQEDALVASDDEEGHRRLIIEPLTNYAIARVRKDLREGRTSVGAAVTSVHRSLEGVKLDWLHDEAYTAGVEGTHRWGGDRFSADFRLAGSYVHGAPEAIDETQTSSVHYYQRPDADHLDYDPNRTSLAGAALLWSIGKSAGGHWRYAVGANARTPGFEVNDLGFQRGADYYTQWLWVQYREDKPGNVLRDYGLNLNLWRTWDTSPRHLYTGGNVNGWLDLLNYWGMGGGIGYDYNVQDPGGLRGGPLLRRNPTTSVWGNLWSDPRKPVSLEVSGSGFKAVAGGLGGNVNPLVTVQARSNLDLSIGPSFSGQVVDNQYVDELQDSMGEPHYLVARIRQVTTALTLRANYTYSPAFSVQLYAQPFVGTGRYHEYKEVVAPQAKEYADRFDFVRQGEFMDDDDGNRAVDQNRDGIADFTFEKPDFNLRELRTNLVLRWEYRPGSALFLIWSHGRTSESPDGRYILSSDLSALADEPGEHVILAKLNYWLGL